MSSTSSSSSSMDKSYMARVQSMPRYYAGGLYRELSTKNVFLFAQAIAFKVLVTIVPIVILLMGVLGDILGQQQPFGTVSRFVRGFLPPYESERLLEFLSAFQGASGAFLSVGTVGLLLTAVTLSTTVRLAISSAFEQDWNEDRTILGGYAFDLRMVVQVGLLFLITVALSFLAQALSSEGLELMRQVGLVRWLRTSWRSTFNTLSLVVPLLVSAAMFFQLFYFIPLPHPPASSAAIGAFITAVLWEVAKYGFALYATYIGTFNYQSASDGMTAVTGGFGLLIAFVLWVYYSGIVLMVGAVIASLHEQRRRVRKQSGEVVAAGGKLEAASHQYPIGDGAGKRLPNGDAAPRERLRRPAATASDVGEATLEASPPAASPSAESPSAESPSAESPSAESPSAESPSGESPSAESPSGESPSGESPSGEDAPAPSPPSADSAVPQRREQAPSDDDAHAEAAPPAREASSEKQSP